MEEVHSQRRLSLSCCNDYAFDVWELPALPRHCQTREMSKFASLTGCNCQTELTAIER